MSQYTHYPITSGGGASGVSSLNTLTGALTLAAGTNITITPSGGNTLTIASTGGGSGSPGGTSGQVQYNNAGAFGGFGSWNGTTFAITGAISSTTTVAVGTNLHVFGTSILAGDLAVQGGANFSGNLGFYGASEIAQPTGNVLTALSNLGLVATPTFSLSNLPTQANNTVLGNTSGGVAVPSAVALGTLTETTSSVLTLNSWADATIGSPTITIKQASTSVSGYLSSTDWNTFNGKQAAGSYITALTGDGTASGGGSAALTLATVNANIGTFASVTVNAKGLVTAAAALTGDITTSSAVSTLATVNSNVGSFTTANITVNAKGLITAASNGSALSNPMTTGGDIIYGGTSGTPTRLANGSSGQFLKSNGGTSAPTWASAATSAPSVQSFTATGTLTGYMFTVTTSIFVTTGDTYTNNGNTYTVLGSLMGGTGSILFMSGTGTPTGTGNLTRSSGAGTTTIAFTLATPLATYTPTAGTAWFRVQLVGGGGGGNGDTGAGTANGTSSFFGANIIVGVGGSAGQGGAGAAGGGSASVTTSGSVLQIAAFSGGGGQNGQAQLDTTGGAGGSSFWGGGGIGGYLTSSGQSGNTNTGSGGGGAGAASTITPGQGGGGAGGYAEAIFTSPAASYPYIIGTGGAAGGTTFKGGAGATGYIVITEYH